MTTSATWFAVTVRPLDREISPDTFDGVCAELMDLGALGTAVDRAPDITCYLEGDESKVQAFVDGLNSIGCVLVSQSQVPQENWTGACPEVWEPITAGQLTVIPVESVEDPRSIPPGAIRIIPGLGFGTGHHATTRMVLAALSELVASSSWAVPKSILDFGTGSGILAIAATMLCKANVQAIDIDPSAIENARDNVALNGVSESVSLSTTPLANVQGTYDLVLANVYGEVLVSTAGDITRLTNPGGMAILSGITEIVWGQVWNAYGPQRGWKLLSERSDGGWVCAILRR